MALFPKDESAFPFAGNAPKRMAWTRESGTRRLLLFFALLALAWYGYNKVREHQLLAVHLPALQPEVQGLTVVGTLDSKESLGRNLLHIIQANKSSRPLLTDYGWGTIFDGRNDLFSDNAGSSIRKAIAQDSDVGYQMLAPYVRVGVDRLMHRPAPESEVRADYPITVQTKGKTTQTTLGALLDKYRKMPGEGSEDDAGSDEGGSEGAREVVHGLPLLPETLVQTCPVVMTGKEFTHADVEETDEPLMGSKRYTIELNLTPEGSVRFYQWSHDHINEHIVFILKGEIITAARIGTTLDRDYWEIGPLQDKASAYALASYVNSRKR